MKNVNNSKLKNECFMKQVDENRFSLRLRTAGGTVRVEDLNKIYELADKYGQGHIHLTSRQCIEIPYIKLEDIEKVKEEMQRSGLRQGACGAIVRTITACQGDKVCPSGLIDTTELALEFDKLYFAKEVPHKFKIGITGCRNNCLKAEENDFGVKGGMKPTWKNEKCNYCGLCEKICPGKSIKTCKQSKTLNYDERSCLLCGKCVKACPVSAWDGKPGFIISCGGLFGNSIQIGKQLIPIIFSKEELHKVVEIVLHFYKQNGKKGERFGHCLNRVGWELLEKELKITLQIKGDID